MAERFSATARHVKNPTAVFAAGFSFFFFFFFFFLFWF